MSAVEQQIASLRAAAARAAEKGKHKKALAAYLQLQALDARSGLWPQRVAELQRRLGHANQAIASWRLALDRYASAGLLLKAIALCKVILTHAPGDEAAHARLASLQSEHAAPDSQVPVPKLPSTTPEPALDQLPLRRLMPGVISERLPSGAPSGVHHIPLESPSPVDDSLQQARALRESQLFAAFDERTLRAAIEEVSFHEVPAHTILFREGDPGDSLYVLAFGEVGVTARGVALAHLGEGEFFGEISVISNHPRSATVTTQVPCGLLQLHREAVARLIHQEPRVFTLLLRFLRHRLVHRLAQTSALFCTLDEEARRRLARNFQFLEIVEHSTPVVAGSPSDGLYILLSGATEVSMATASDDRILATLGPGDLFGEMSLLTGDPAGATVTTRTKCLALRLPRESFRAVTAHYPHVLSVIDEIARKRRAQAVPSVPPVDARSILWSPAADS